MRNVHCSCLCYFTIILYWCIRIDFADELSTIAFKMQLNYFLFQKECCAHRSNGYKKITRNGSIQNGQSMKLDTCKNAK